MNTWSYWLKIALVLKYVLIYKELQSLKRRKTKGNTTKQFKYTLSAPKSFTDFTAYMFKDFLGHISFKMDLLKNLRYPQVMQIEAN